MLTLLLRSEIDNKWEACWPVSQVKPFAFFELLSFLFFIRKIEGLHPAADPVTGTVFTTKEFEKLRWSTFNGMDAQNMHNLFTRKNGLIDLMTNYSYSGERYQSFFKEPLLLTPTPKLLFNSVNLIKVLEGQGQDTRREIFTYLLNKVEITAQSGQVYTPQPVAQLVVSMLAPQMDDTILDILAGDGSFLAGCITHIATAGGDSHGFNRDLFPNLNGTDIDPAALRIAAMNLMLHGVEEPVLQKLKPLDNAIINAKGGATVAFANLIFKESDGKLGAAHNAFKEDFYNKEVQLLEILLNNLAVGGRAAVIIPPVLLHNNKEEVLKIRQRIVDEHTLEAVIRLPQKQGAFFSGAAILVFSRQPLSATYTTWFYKIPGTNNSAELSDTDSTHESLLSTHQADQIVRLWQTKKQNYLTGTHHSFYIPIDQVRTNNYNLGFSTYSQLTSPGTFGVKDSAVDTTRSENASAKNLVYSPPTENNRFKSPRKRLLVVISAALFVIVLTLCFITFRNHNLFTNTASSPYIGAGSHGQRDSAHGSNGQVIAVNVVQPEVIAKKSVDNGRRLQGRKIPKQTVQASGSLTDGSREPLRQQYTVISKAYFHNAPDERTRRNAFVNHWNNSVLRPLQDANGFVYVVYTNHLGQVSKGWLNKKDLRAL